MTARLGSIGQGAKWQCLLALACGLWGGGDASALPPAGLRASAPTPAPIADEAGVVHRIAVFGVDNRAKLPKRLEALRGSIGIIYNERSRTICSAFCIADDVIATASHCVFRTKGEKPPPTERFYFARPGTRLASVRFEGAASRRAAHYILAGAAGISTKPPIEAARDWALIMLQGPACRGKVLEVKPLTPDEIEGEAKAGRLYQAAFHRDYGRWTMAYSQPCFGGRRGDPDVPPPTVTARDFADHANLVLHSCDTGGASSGSPLLIETAAGPHVVAINVGTFVQSRVLIEGGEVVKRAPAAPVANTAVSAIAFAGKVEALRAASVLRSAGDLRKLQQRLQSAQVFDGPVNGRYDVRLRLAIESYEVREGLPVLGLPTRTLLDALERGTGAR